MLTLGAIAVGDHGGDPAASLFDVRWRLLPLGVILVGVIWAFGLAGYLGIPLSVVTIAGLPGDARRRHRLRDPDARARRGGGDHRPRRAPDPGDGRATSGPALLVVTFDAVFAFPALRFAKVPMIRDFGLLLAVGIAVDLHLPASSCRSPILGIREYKSPTTGRDFREGSLGRLVVWLGSLPAWIAPCRSPWPASSSSSAASLVEDKLDLQTDPIEWVNQDSQAIKDIDTLEEETGSRAELGIFVAVRRRVQRRDGRRS